MSEMVVISEERLEQLLEQATKRGYELARKDAEDSEWLRGQAQIITFLSDPNKRMSDRTFIRHREKGMYGEAIVGTGPRAVARKSDLMQAMQLYQLRQY